MIHFNSKTRDDPFVIGLSVSLFQQFDYSPLGCIEPSESLVTQSIFIYLG